LVLATICRRPVTLTFDLLTLKSVWKSHVTWGTPVQSFVFLGLLVFELEPMYATSDSQTDGRTTDADDRLMPPPPLRGRGHNKCRPIIMHSSGKLSYSFTLGDVSLQNEGSFIIPLHSKYRCSQHTATRLVHWAR